MKKLSFTALVATLVFGLILIGFGSSASADVKTINLKFATHLPSMHHGYKNFMKPWADEVGKRTQGRVKVRVYTDQQLGKLPEMYDRTVDGTSDIALIIPSAIRGAFPLEDVFHLPTLIPGDMMDPRCKAISEMVYDKYLKPRYFQNVKVLWTGRFGLSNLHMVEKPVAKLEDFKGKVIGFAGGRVIPMFLKVLGPSAEMIRPGDVYTALERKVVDGTFYPLDSLKGWKFAEVVKYTTLIDFGSSSNIIIMNKDSWKKLSPEDQKIMTEELIPLGYELQAKTYRLNAEIGMEYGKKEGVKFITLSPEERKRWDDALETVNQEWIKEYSKMDLPAQELYDDIMKLRNN
jgi:TRAP-type C4-dicarboxylate transport system substrate-binding protein